MKILVDSVLPERTTKALEVCGFPTRELVFLGDHGGEMDGAKNVPCPSHPGNARTAVYIMQLQLADALVSVWDGRDMELINLARDMEMPIFILYRTAGHEMGFRLNWEEDF